MLQDIDNLEGEMKYVRDRNFTEHQIIKEKRSTIIERMNISN